MFKKNKFLIFFEIVCAVSICLFAARILKTKAASVYSTSLSFFSDDNSAPEPSATPEFNGMVTSSHTTAATSSAITIEWDSVEDADGYSLALTYNNQTTTLDTEDTSYEIKELSPATIVTYNLTCYKKNILGQKQYGTVSQEFKTCSSVTKVTGIALADKLTAADGNGQITLVWDTLGNASYKVYYKPKENSEFVLSGLSTSNSYTVTGLNASAYYDFYVQAYCLTEENTGDASNIISDATLPSIVSDFKSEVETETQIELSWNENASGNYYNLYRSVNDGPYELLLQTTETSYIDLNLDPGTVCSYQITSVSENTGLESARTGVLRCASRPTAASGVAISEGTAESISITWEENNTATGYLIYRKKGSGSYVYLASTTSLSYTDTGLDSGTNYRYKLLTYTDTANHPALSYSNEVKTSTLPAKLTVTGKAGFGKVRLSWPATTGAQGYYIYQFIDGNYQLIDTLKGKSNVSKTYENMTVGTSYIYSVSAYRTAFSQSFTGENSEQVTVKPVKTKKTTTVPSYYKTKKTLLNSAAWSKVASVKKYANYNKCVTIPGIKSTNVGGFESTKMCPQGITFAKKYLLITAYDTYSEEKSVIYIMDKYTRKLLSVAVLPNKPHAGGICFDGSTVWVTNGKKISGVAFSDINQAATKKMTYKEVTYAKTFTTNYTCSFLTYYKNLIWTGDFQYTKNGTLRSYSIVNPNSDTSSLKEKSSVTIPAAVQGLTFATGGKLVLSRAYGYTNELNIYKPAKTGTASMKLGKKLKTVITPALNEGIAINATYLYVNFESALPGSLALNHMDRVVAFKLKSILK